MEALKVETCVKFLCIMTATISHYQASRKQVIVDMHEPHTPVQQLLTDQKFVRSLHITEPDGTAGPISRGRFLL